MMLWKRQEECLEREICGQAIAEVILGMRREADANRNPGSSLLLIGKKAEYLDTHTGVLEKIFF